MVVYVKGIEIKRMRDKEGRNDRETETEGERKRDK